MNTLRLILVVLTLVAAPALQATIAADQSADLVLGRKFGNKNAFGDPSGVAVDPVTHKVFSSLTPSGIACCGSRLPPR